MGVVPDVIHVAAQSIATHASHEILMVLNDARVIGLSLNGKSFPAAEAYVGQVGDGVVAHYYN